MSIGGGIFRGHLITLRRFLLTFLRDIQAGHAADMTTVAAAWGYCGHSEPLSWNADLLAESPLHLIKFLQPA